MQPSISSIFNQFAGCEVPMKEETFVSARGRSYTRVSLADENDATIKEMEETAKKNGVNLRIWFPGMMGTMDWKPHRVNARIEKSADGKYRVSDKFDLG